jgi:hypothetical protein
MDHLVYVYIDLCIYDFNHSLHVDIGFIYLLYFSSLGMQMNLP